MIYTARIIFYQYKLIANEKLAVPYKYIITCKIIVNICLLHLIVAIKTLTIEDFNNVNTFVYTF